MRELRLRDIAWVLAWCRVLDAESIAPLYEALLLALLARGTSEGHSIVKVSSGLITLHLHTITTAIHHPGRTHTVYGTESMVRCRHSYRRAKDSTQRSV